jgi:hypothetical protein
VSLFRRLFGRSNPPAAVERPCPIQAEPEVPGSVAKQTVRTITTSNRLVASRDPAANLSVSSS